MPKRSSNGDLNVTAFSIVQQAAAEQPTTIGQTLDNAALRRQLMQEMGRRGGVKGGKARAAKLSKSRRSEIAQAAAKKRWKEANKDKRK